MSEVPIGVQVDEGTREAYLPALATLPASFRSTGHGPVRILDGRPDWPHRLTGIVDAAVVILVAPEPVDESGLALVEGLPTPVVVDLPWASNPAMDSVIARTSGDVAAVVEITGSLPLTRGLHAALIEVAMLAEAVNGPVDIRGAALNDSAVSASGSAGAARLHVSLIRSDAGGSALRAAIHSPHSQIILELPAENSAAPGRVTTVTVEGSRTLPTIYQDTHRTSLIRAEQIIKRGSPESQLPALARANRVVNGAMRSMTA